MYRQVLPSVTAPRKVVSGSVTEFLTVVQVAVSATGSIAITDV